MPALALWLLFTVLITETRLALRRALGDTHTLATLDINHRTNTRSVHTLFCFLSFLAITTRRSREGGILRPSYCIPAYSRHKYIHNGFSICLLARPSKPLRQKVLNQGRENKSPGVSVGINIHRWNGAKEIIRKRGNRNRLASWDAEHILVIYLC